MVSEKKKRVRTGCLTCRERHLKCDENFPKCLKCQKSNRECKRGVKLNFVDIKLFTPENFAACNQFSSFSLCDESRAIASEYQDGVMKYPNIPVDPQNQPYLFVYTPEREQILSSKHKKMRSFHKLDSNSTYPILFSPLTGNTKQDTVQSTPILKKIVVSELLSPLPEQPYNQSQEQQRLPSLPSSADLLKSAVTWSDSSSNSTAKLSSSPISSRDASSMSPPIFESSLHRNSWHNTETEQQENIFSNVDHENTFRSFPSLSASFQTDPKILCYFNMFTTLVGPVLDNIVTVPVFRRIIPTIALTNPLLHNAVMACGAKFQSNQLQAPEEIAKRRVCLADSEQYLADANRLLVAELINLTAKSTEKKQKNRVTPTSSTFEVVISASLLVTLFEFTNGVSNASQTPLMGLQHLFKEYQSQIKAVPVLSSSPFETPDKPSAIIDACYTWALHLDFNLSWLLKIPPVIDTNLFETKQFQSFASLSSTAQKPGAAQHEKSSFAGLSRIMKLALQLQSVLKASHPGASAQTMSHLNIQQEQLKQQQKNQQETLSQQKLALLGISRDVQQWYTELPTAMRSLYDFEQLNPFPEIYFPLEVCAIGHIIYHLTMIELIEARMLPQLAEHNISSSSLSDTMQCSYHAIRLCGIVLTNGATGSLNMCSAWCLAVVAKYIYRQDQRDLIKKHLQSLIDIGWISGTAGFVEHIVNTWNRQELVSGLPTQPF